LGKRSTPAARGKNWVKEASEAWEGSQEHGEGAGSAQGEENVKKKKKKKGVQRGKGRAFQLREQNRDLEPLKEPLIRIKGKK